MPSSDLNTLKKILELEARKGYTDTAVIGGLDKFIAIWASKKKIARLVRLSKGEYTKKSLPKKKKWINDVLDLLNTNARITFEKGGSRKPSELNSQSINAGDNKTYDLGSLITELPRVSTRMSNKLKKLGIYTIKDLLYLLPRRHNDYSNLCKIAELRIDMEQTVMVNIWDIREVLLGGRHKAAEAIVGDDSGNIRVVWFNQPYLARSLKTGDRIVLSGKVGKFNNALVFESPEHEILRQEGELIHTGRMVPVYPSTEGIVPRTFRTLIKETLDKYAQLLEDPYTEKLRQSVGLIDLTTAITQYHYPNNEDEKESARYRLAFDELFMIQLYVLTKRHEWSNANSSVSLQTDHNVTRALIKYLPFDLTKAQSRSLGEILSDMNCEKPMSRLLQGDVGSGKTAVALIALLSTVHSGYQGALMAPTEILVQQHFHSISTILERIGEVEPHGHWLKFHTPEFEGPILVGMLTSGLKNSQKKEINLMMADGHLNIVIGTHALAQNYVDLPLLALAIVDEQHRFGVMQRTSLRNKGKSPHLLVMSATPIPRSLALTLYGDLDLSVLDELPPGRQQVITKHIDPSRRNATYDFIRKQVLEGRQAFVVCPLIEESEALQTRAATTEFEKLSEEIFPELALGLLHGRMSSRDKIRIMDDFKMGIIDILVSTPVVEVGIDNPNATVILIEGSDRFGLAQLHQFRGRVGRGEHSSYCILMSDYPSSEARERLTIMEKFSDGFALAEEDLRFRGPGDFFGTRQSGLPDLRIAKLSDQDILALARQEAISLIEHDPGLTNPENKQLAKSLLRFSDFSEGGVS